MSYWSLLDPTLKYFSGMQVGRNNYLLYQTELKWMVLSNSFIPDDFKTVKSFHYGTHKIKSRGNRKENNPTNEAMFLFDI